MLEIRVFLRGLDSGVQMFLVWYGVYETHLAAGFFENDCVRCVCEYVCVCVRARSQHKHFRRRGRLPVGGAKLNRLITRPAFSRAPAVRRRWRGASALGPTVNRRVSFSRRGAGVAQSSQQTHLDGIVAGETLLVLLVAQNDERAAELVEGNATGERGHVGWRFGHGLQADEVGFAAQFWHFFSADFRELRLNSRGARKTENETTATVADWLSEI